MSNPPSGTSTPKGFATQSTSAEDLLKSQTVGLVNLSDFRKRRAHVLEQKEKEAREVTTSARGTPVGDLRAENDGGVNTDSEPVEPKSTSSTVVQDRHKKKRKKILGKGLLSFDEGEDEANVPIARNGQRQKPGAEPKRPQISAGLDVDSERSDADIVEKAGVRKFAANPHSTLPAPKAMTKANMAAEAAKREKLRKDFLEMQEKVKNSEIMIPFVFHDGSNVPGGAVRLKKGDHVWLFLERCRKVGAEIGTIGENAVANGMGNKSREDSKRQWARVGVDDLMCVRGNVIVPHHYEIYYFVANQVPDPSGQRKFLFDYSGVESTNDLEMNQPETQLLRVPGKEAVEGKDDDPNFTKVVDRRWYEKNKHIYPASLWKEFKAGQEWADVAKGQKDAQGNSFFY